MDLNKIKLIIWDLDETFWKDTISEEEVVIVDEHCKFIKHLTDRGIMNSICSKNDFDQVRSRLESEGLWDYFVFPSIDWTPKGKRIADIITKMSLRPVNVLFIDDNPMNLNEAKYYLPDLNVMHIDNIEEIIDESGSVGKDDRQHKRLKQYHQLEKKVEASSHFESTDEFLLQSEITVTIENDCAQRLGRIHEMVERTNQLNFTKLRSSMEELRNTVENPSMECGVVSAKDKYGDYGVVGFYALDREKNSLLHFLFSCRTMGMGIEQYVYEMLHFPALEIHGDVSATLERVQKVHWIKQSKGKGLSLPKEETCLNDKDICRILLKGPCDMDSVLPYLGKNSGCKLETEFNYVDSRGVAITAMNHTEMIKAADTLTDYEQNMLLRDAPFLEAGVFETKLKGGDYDIVFCLCCLTAMKESIAIRKAG